MVGLSEGEKHFIRGGIAQDLRTDGRRRLQFRSLSVQTGVIPQVGFTTRFGADTHTPLSFPFFFFYLIMRIEFSVGVPLLFQTFVPEHVYFFI